MLHSFATNSVLGRPGAGGSGAAGPGASGPGADPSGADASRRHGHEHRRSASGTAGAGGVARGSRGEARHATLVQLGRILRHASAHEEPDAPSASGDENRNDDRHDGRHDDRHHDDDGAGVRVSVVDTHVIEDDGEGNKHVEYELECRLGAPRHSKRYTEFKELDAALRRRFPHTDLPAVPVSRRFRIFPRRTLDAQYVQAKGRLLSTYLNELAAIAHVRCSPEFLHFVLQPKRHHPALPPHDYRASRFPAASSSSSSLPSLRAGSPVQAPSPSPSAEGIASPRLGASVARRQWRVEAEDSESYMDSTDDEDDDEEDEEDENDVLGAGAGDGLVPLVAVPLAPLEAHLLLGPMLGAPQRVVLRGCASLSDVDGLGADAVVVLLFESSQTLVDVSNVRVSSTDDDIDELSAETCLDGHRIAIVGRVELANRTEAGELRGVVSISLLEEHERANRIPVHTHP